MKTLSSNDKTRLLDILQTVRELEKSEIVAVRDYATHIMAETRCILDQLLVVPPDGRTS